MSTVSQLNRSAEGLESFGDEAPATLLSVRQTRRVIAKERMRCDRFGHFFCAILISLRCRRSQHRRQLGILAEILRRRLRLTDEFGLIDGGRVAVILPMTSRSAGETVLLSIARLAADKSIAFDAEIITYPINPSENFNGEGGNSADEQSAPTPEAVDNQYASPYGSPVATAALAPRRQVTAYSRGVVPSHDSLVHLVKRYPRWKRAFDLAAAGCGMILAAPIIAVAATAIRLSSSGPAFYLQERTGQYGRTFKIIKLRTMVTNAEALKPLLLERNERDGPAFKMTDDPRVTRIGRLLRRTGVDELPQLINVLRGEMAIVGPRPLPCEEQAECELWQHRRLDTKPGLTCYWQISKGRKMSFAEWMRMDLQYDARRSPWCDAGLIVRTCASVVLGRVGH